MKHPSFLMYMWKMDLTLLTIRHYQKEMLEKLIQGRKIVLQQWSSGNCSDINDLKA